MAGQTHAYRAQLRAQVDDPTYEEIIDLSRKILATLPRTDRIGSLAAALQLASLSFVEYGVSAAQALVDETKRNQRT